MGRIEPIRTKEDILIYLLVMLILPPVLVYGENASWGEAIMLDIAMSFLYIIVSLPSWISMQRGAIEILKRCKDYIADNIVKIGLFVRPSINKNKITLANKYCTISFNISNALTNIKLLDKISGIEKTIKVNKTFYEIIISKNNHNQIYSLFLLICSLFNYDVTADEIEEHCKRKHPFLYNWKIRTKKYKNLYLDINQASEAELTAIPGVTIAKAKHAVKVRKQQKLFLTMNQFYKAINLDEEFIEQIHSKGNKILLNELPEYQRLEIKKNID